MLRRATEETVAAWWSEYLGVARDALASGVSVVPHAAALADYRGVYAIRTRDALVVSAPMAHVGALGAAVQRLSPAKAFDAGVIEGALGEAAGIVVGPAWIGYSDTATHSGLAARLLEPADGDALTRMLDTCTVTEREHSGITPDSAPVFAVFDGSEIIAAASWKERGPRIRHAGVLADPVHRGRGHARAAAAALTDAGVAGGLVMQWQTLYENTPSLAIGRALGYQHRIDTIAVRLR